MKNTRHEKKPGSAETIARTADNGKDVSGFFTNSGAMRKAIQRVDIDSGGGGVEAPLGVNSLHDVHQTASRGSTARRDHLQRADLDAAPRASRRAVPYGGRRDSDRFD